MFSSINRGGLQGSVFELDDRNTGYDVQGTVDARFAGEAAERMKARAESIAGVFQNDMVATSHDRLLDADAETLRSTALTVTGPSSYRNVPGTLVPWSAVPRRPPSRRGVPTST